MRLTSFSREDLDECLEFLKTNCFMRRKSEDDKPVMYTCGIGGYQYGKKIESTLDVMYVIFLINRQLYAIESVSNTVCRHRKILFLLDREKFIFFLYRNMRQFFVELLPYKRYC